MLKKKKKNCTSIFSKINSPTLIFLDRYLSFLVYFIVPDILNMRYGEYVVFCKIFVERFPSRLLVHRVIVCSRIKRFYILPKRRQVRIFILESFTLEVFERLFWLLSRYRIYLPSFLNSCLSCSFCHHPNMFDES